MKTLPSLVSFGWLLLCACSQHSLPAGDDGAGVANAAEIGRVLVVAPPTTDASLSDEAYADWAAYLNDFAAEHPEITFQRIEPEQLRKELANAPALSGKYATIFIRSDGMAAFYDGMILEPFVYEEGADFLAGRVSAPQYLELLTGASVR